MMSATPIPSKPCLRSRRAAVSIICSRFSSAFSRDTLMLLLAPLVAGPDLRLVVQTTAERSQIRKNSA